METKKSKKYNQLKLAHSFAAEAHAYAVAGYAVVDNTDRTCTLVEAALAAVELTKEAFRASTKVSELELELLGTMPSLSADCLKGAEKAATITDGAKGGAIHDKVREDHEAVFRYYAILEHREEMKYHQRLVEAAEQEKLSHSQILGRHEKEIEILERIGRPALTDRPEFERFAAIVGNFDWTGTLPDDEFSEHVMPSLQAATLDFAREAGLELPDVEDDSQEKERYVIFDLVESAYVDHLHEITSKTQTEFSMVYGKDADGL